MGGALKTTPGLIVRFARSLSAVVAGTPTTGPVRQRIIPVASYL